jgi:hypothetical protein
MFYKNVHIVRTTVQGRLRTKFFILVEGLLLMGVAHCLQQRFNWFVFESLDAC